jgi:hypothetical protein
MDTLRKKEVARVVDFAETERLEEHDERLIPDAPLLIEVALAIHARALQAKEWTNPALATRRHMWTLRDLGNHCRRELNFQPDAEFIGEAMTRLLDMAAYYGIDPEQAIRAYHERQLTPKVRHLRKTSASPSRHLTGTVTLFPSNQPPRRAK